MADLPREGEASIAAMEPSNHDHRLQLIETRVWLLTRVALCLVLLLTIALASFTWPQEKSPAATRLKQVGRYQIAGAEFADGHRFVVVDTRTGVSKPIRPMHYWRAFDDVHEKKR